MIVKFPYSASRRIAARRPRRSKNGTPEERAAKAAAASTHATVAAIQFDPATWLRLCEAAGLKVYDALGRMLLDASDADWDQVVPLLSQFAGTPGAKDQVQAILRAEQLAKAQHVALLPPGSASVS